MKYFNSLLIILITTILTHCTDNLERVVADKFENGTPKRIDYFKIEEKSKSLVKQIRYYENGEKKSEGEFNGEVKNGKWSFWHENGELWSVGYFENGLRTGESKIYNKKGLLKYTGNYLKGKPDGEWIFYTNKGDKAKKVIYKNGEITEQDSFIESTEMTEQPAPDENSDPDKPKQTDKQKSAPITSKPVNTRK